MQGAGCRVQGSGSRVQGSGFRVQGAGFRVQGSVCRVQGSGFRVQGCLALALRLARRHRTQQRRDGVVRAKPERGGCFTVERFR